MLTAAVLSAATGAAARLQERGESIAVAESSTGGLIAAALVAQDEAALQNDEAAIKAAQPDVEVFTYPGAQHGFGCEERPSYNPRDTELAELRSLAFFAEHLR